MNVQPIRCDAILPDPRSGGYQAAAIEVLADDIRAHGMLRPVLVRETENGYVIVHGERRWRAARLLGLEAIPALVVQALARDEEQVA